MPFAPDDLNPYVTVFIPTWNGGELFEEVLTELKATDVDRDWLLNRTGRAVYKIS